MVQINGDRLIADLRTLATIGKVGTGVDRVALSAADIEARRWLCDRMREAGLEAQMDRSGTYSVDIPTCRSRSDRFAYRHGAEWWLARRCARCHLWTGDRTLTTRKWRHAVPWASTSSPSRMRKARTFRVSAAVRFATTSPIPKSERPNRRAARPLRSARHRAQ